MKKIILASTIFFMSLFICNNIAASLQQDLVLLSDNLVGLEKLLSRSKTKKELEQYFVKLLREAQELAITQEESFNNILYYLKGIDSSKEIVSIYGGMKRNYERSLGVANNLRELVTKIYFLQDEPLVINKFNRVIIDLYQKIKNDWQRYSDGFNAFVKKNNNSSFFNKDVYIKDGDTEIEDFKLKPYFEEINSHISETNISLQSVLSDYIEEFKAQKAL